MPAFFCVISYEIKYNILKMRKNRKKDRRIPAFFVVNMFVKKLTAFAGVFDDWLLKIPVINKYV